MTPLSAMALLKYFKPSPGSTPPSCSSSLLAEVEEETKRVQEKGKKRGQYTRLSQEEKAKVARYASENGVPNTLRS